MVLLRKIRTIDSDKLKFPYLVSTCMSMSVFVIESGSYSDYTPIDISEKRFPLRLRDNILIYWS